MAKEHTHAHFSVQSVRKIERRFVMAMCVMTIPYCAILKTLIQEILSWRF